MPDPNQSDDLVRVLETPDPMHASMAANELEAEGIPSVTKTLDSRLIGVHPFSDSVELFVSPEDAPRARAIIEQSGYNAEPQQDTFPREQKHWTVIFKVIVFSAFLIVLSDHRYELVPLWLIMSFILLLIGVIMALRKT